MLSDHVKSLWREKNEYLQLNV